MQNSKNKPAHPNQLGHHEPQVSTDFLCDLLALHCHCLQTVKDDLAIPSSCNTVLMRLLSNSFPRSVLTQGIPANYFLNENINQQQFLCYWDCFDVLRKVVINHHQVFVMYWCFRQWSFQIHLNIPEWLVWHQHLTQRHLNISSWGFPLLHMIPPSVQYQLSMSASRNTLVPVVQWPPSQCVHHDHEGTLMQ